MKLGTENKKTTITAVALLTLAGLLFYRGLHSPSAGAQARKAPAVEQPVSASSNYRPGTHHYIAFLLKPTLDPQLRLDLLAQSEGIKYEGSGRDIFVEQPDDIPKPIAPALLEKADLHPWQPPALPPPPPINLKFWGWASRPGEAKAVFLAQGEAGFLAHEGDIVARRYRVVKINPSSVEIEDLLNNNRQSIPVGF